MPADTGKQGMRKGKQAHLTNQDAIFHRTKESKKGEAALPNDRREDNCFVPRRRSSGCLCGKPVNHRSTPGSAKPRWTGELQQMSFNLPQVSA